MVTYKPGIGSGSYKVLVNGQERGEVRKRIESLHGISGSNGRRLGRYTYWDAYNLKRERIVRGAHTRREAAHELT